MKFMLRVPLNTTPAQMARLMALQGAFAQVCNALSPVVVQTKVWNRVALHHLMYRTLRERFPDMGSQMVCNAIYSVSRTCRLVYQSPQSPFNMSRMRDKPLPMVRFSDNSPVYFDRHTLSVKSGQLSMYTLDGRMRFALALTPADEAQFKAQKLFEIMMSRRPDGLFELAFLFGDLTSNPPGNTPPEPAQMKLDAQGDVTMQVFESGGADLPEYVLVEEAT
jgi:hypothetical protein